MTRKEILDDPYLTNIVLQLSILTKKHVDNGESPEQLVEAYLTRIEKDTVRWIEEDGQVVAFASYNWILDQSQVGKPCRERIKGDVLEILKAWAARPGLLWELKKLAPPHRHICWRHDNEVHAPKGWPNEEATQEA